MVVIWFQCLILGYCEVNYVCDLEGVSYVYKGKSLSSSPKPDFGLMYFNILTIMTWDLAME